MDETLKMALVFGGVTIGAAAFFFGLRHLIGRQAHAAAIGSIKRGEGVVAEWHYSPEDWKLAAVEYFQINPRRLAENAKASFTERHVFVTNGRDEILYELIGPQRYVKHLTDVKLHKHSGVDAVRFEVRTKTIKKDENGRDTMEEDYEVETFYVPVPGAAREEGERVVKFYQNLLDENADAVASVMPYGLGLFRK